MRYKTAVDRDGAGLSRREFAITLAAGAACRALPGGATRASEVAGSDRANTQTSAPRSAEAEAQYQLLISKYGARLSDEQKADVRRLIDQAQKSTVSLRSFQLNNADEPANVFRAGLRS
jgi:hypothetical protein